MNTIRRKRTNSPYRHAYVTAAGAIALAVCGLGHAAQPDDELRVLTQAQAASAEALAAEIEASVTEARERLKRQLRLELDRLEFDRVAPPASEAPLRLSELGAPERG